jgi:uncharacterized protein YhjY with autotransporter beta-barrel domain
MKVQKKVRLLATVCGLGLAIGGGVGPAFAQAGNAEFQTFFVNACAASSGALANQCAVSNGGDLSGDSESSLNPNQTAVAASNALAKAQALAAQTEARLEALRDEENGKPGADTGRIAGFGPWSIFANFEAEWFDQDRQPYANERAYDGDRFRGTAGVDYRLNAATHIGLSLSYEDYTSSFVADLPGRNFVPQANGGGVKNEAFAATVFASSMLGENAWIDLSAGIGWSDYDFRRNAVFQESTRTIAQTNVSATGSANGKQYFASLGLGYDFSSGALSIGPYVRGRWTRSTIDAYAENDPGGTGLALNVSKQKANSLTGILGLDMSYAIGASWGVIVPQARIEYEHEFDDDPRTTLTSLVLDSANTPFAITNDAPDRDYFNAGIGLVFVLPGGVMPFIDYEALIGYSNLKRHRVAAGIRLEL